MKIKPSRISASLSWRKAVVFAQALLDGKRWHGVLLKLVKDPAITPRLWDQALACHCAYKGLDYEFQRTVAQKEVDALAQLGHANGLAAAAGR